MLRRLLSYLVDVRRAQVHAPERVSPTESDSVDRLIAEGNRVEATGDLQAACELYRRAVDAAPRYARAHLNLGIGLEAIGDAEHAMKAYRAALAIDPNDTYANYNLAKLLFSRGLHSEVERLLHCALRQRPDFPEAHVVLSQLFEVRGNLNAAAVALESALKYRPDYFGAWFCYGSALRQLGRLAEAETALQRALAIDPENADANYQLAAMLQARSAPKDVEPYLLRVLARDPGRTDARAALFHLYRREGNATAAIAQLEAALRLNPDWADALFNYGLLLKNARRLTEAESALRHLIAIDPGYAQAYRILGGVLLSQIKTDEALQMYEMARNRHPENLDLASAELFALNFSEDITSDTMFARHKAFGTRLEALHPPRALRHRNPPDPTRPLTVGYVSGDFSYHVVTLFMLPLLERHDRSCFEIYCYSTGDATDDFTRRVAALADVWRPVAEMSEAELAEAVEGDGIDILVDLSGHSGISQLGVFARQPAPVQATWLGYLNTTGLTRVDYRICDRHTDPPGIAERCHTERLVRLPNSQWCYRPFVSVEGVRLPPSRANGFVTFGSFNQASKLSRSVRRLWAQILEKVPDSRLVALSVSEGPAQEELLREFSNAGIARARITLLPYLSLDNYYRQFEAVDVALDTTPYSGATTTCDTLWMGVPVVTLAGDRPTSRSAASVLSTVGLREWIAVTPEEYVRLAVKLATDVPLLADLRQNLRRRMRDSALMDEPQFARELEDAYRRMWRAWCERELHEHPHHAS